MKKTLIRAISFFLTLSLLTGLLIPFASAIEYEGVESMTVDATAALLIDLDTDQVLYEQAADEQRYPASITKIMTALLTLEAIGRGELDLNTEITVDAAALADITEDSSTVNLQAGEKITVKNLLYCLLLASANEAANVLAMAVSGDIPTFVELMNQRAQELGMAGTHFVNPHGLHNADHYSTARDIYRMSKQAMTHATFREIVSTGRYTVPATNLSKARSLLNTNGLLTSAKHYGYTMDGTIGIKTGSTGEAGYCLVAAVQKKGHTLVSVVLGAQNPTDSRGNVQRKQFTESKRLLNWGFTNFSDATLLDADAAAASEIMYDLLGQMGVEITAQIADCLYTGIATDTGCFRFANTTARSHITAAWLMEAGARASELNARLFESKKPQRVEAERLALNNLEYYFDGRCALIYLTREDILSSGVAPSDLEDLTSLPRAIEGVEVGLTLRQQPGGSYKISVRTTDEVDACAIAKRLGGGGHVRAAGCELMGNLDNAKAAVLAEVKKELARCEQKE